VVKILKFCEEILRLVKAAVRLEYENGQLYLAYRHFGNYPVLVANISKPPTSGDAGGFIL